jgi:hypothetical protein
MVKEMVAILYSPGRNNGIPEWSSSFDQEYFSCSNRNLRVVSYDTGAAKINALPYGSYMSNDLI